MLIPQSFPLSLSLSLSLSPPPPPPPTFPFPPSLPSKPHNLVNHGSSSNTPNLSCGHGPKPYIQPHLSHQKLTNPSQPTTKKGEVHSLSSLGLPWSPSLFILFLLKTPHPLTHSLTHSRPFRLKHKRRCGFLMVSRLASAKKPHSLFQEEPFSLSLSLKGH